MTDEKRAGPDGPPARGIAPSADEAAEFAEAWKAHNDADVLDAQALNAERGFAQAPARTAEEWRRRQQLVTDLRTQARGIRQALDSRKSGEFVTGAQSRADAIGLPRVLPLSRDGELPGDRQRRRYERFRDLGGVMVCRGGSWLCQGRRGALAQLVKEEGADGRPMSNKTNIRRELQKATAAAPDVAEHEPD